MVIYSRVTSPAPIGSPNVTLQQPATMLISQILERGIRVGLMLVSSPFSTDEYEVWVMSVCQVALSKVAFNTAANCTLDPLQCPQMSAPVCLSGYAIYMSLLNRPADAPSGWRIAQLYRICGYRPRLDVPGHSQHLRFDHNSIFRLQLSCQGGLLRPLARYIYSQEIQAAQDRTTFDVMDRLPVLHPGPRLYSEWLRIRNRNSNHDGCWQPATNAHKSRSDWAAIQL